MRPPPLIYIDIPMLRPGTVGAFAFAFACAAVATAIRLAVDVESAQYVTFFPAVMIATLVNGLGAGLFYLALSVAAAAFFLLPPLYSFYIADLAEQLITLLFISITFALVIVIAGMRFSIESHQRIDRELEQHKVALREREDCLATLIGELQHRNRNLLTVVGSIADNTMKKSSSFADFSAKYHNRIEALARAQSLPLCQQRGDGVTCDELIEAELVAQAVNGRDGGRHGCALRLTPRKEGILS